MSTPTLHQLLHGKRFGLVLSAGYFGFYGHLGFLRGLLTAGLQPAVYAGTSAGGMVSAYAATGAPLEAVESLVLGLRRERFWDPDPVGAVVEAARRGPGASGLLKGERLRQLLEETLPVRTFEALRHPLLLVATNLSRSQPQAFTSGELAPCIHAAAAYPGLFRAVRLGNDLYWDGGLVDKAPALALHESPLGRELEALVVHYLPSRVQSELSGPLAYAQGVAIGSAALRREHFRLQLSVLQGRGVPVYVIVSQLPAVSPSQLERGREALEQARLSAERALAQPPVPFEEQT